jgi:uncharacterized protein YodC (DUF2158 family)
MISGDVVKLKSGGPRMVVESVDIDTHKIKCIYMRNGEIVRQCVAEETLIRYLFLKYIIVYFTWLLAMTMAGFSLGRLI